MAGPLPRVVDPALQGAPYFNAKSLFKRILVTEEGVIDSEYSEPFATLMHAHEGTQAVIHARALASANGHCPRANNRTSPDHSARAASPSGFERESFGGGSGIRTHGEFPHTRFPSVPIRPLSHPSSSTARRWCPGRTRLSCRPTRSRMWWSGPVQSESVNRVRAGRQQLSAEPLVCRRSPDHHIRERVRVCGGPAFGRAATSPAAQQAPPGVGHALLLGDGPSCASGRSASGAPQPT